MCAAEVAREEKDHFKWLSSAVFAVMLFMATWEVIGQIIDYSHRTEVTRSGVSCKPLTFHKIKSWRHADAAGLACRDLASPTFVQDTRSVLAAKRWLVLQKAGVRMRLECDLQRNLVAARCELRTPVTFRPGRSPGANSSWPKRVMYTLAMSGYYKPDRNPNWNYGGSAWRLSRSKISLFLDCPRCFYIDNKLGTARPPGYPFNLNSAVDALLKKEFNVHRADKTSHPLMKEYGLEAVPFAHAKMDEWRDALRGGVVVKHSTGMTICGGVDDIWVTPKNELIVVDYKATSKDGKIESLDEEWHDGYKRQIEVYQWLLRQSGFTVSNTGYWVYANADKDKKAFDGQLEFELTLVPYKGDDSWVEGTLQEINKCLDSDELPKPSDACDYCKYRETVGKKLMAFAPKKKTGA